VLSGDCEREALKAEKVVVNDEKEYGGNYYRELQVRFVLR